MRNHVCWRVEALQAAMDTEALQTEDAYFLACHSPMVVKRADTLTGSALRESVDQDQFLAEFLDTSRSHTQLMVLGASGTGKSHLVRWMELRCPKTDERHVLLIRKTGTNLKRVVESILGGFEGQEFDELRRRLSEATAALTPERARLEFLNALAIGVGPEGPYSHEVRDDRIEQQDHEEIMQLLPALLNDEAFRQPLLRDGGTVAQIAEQITGTLGYERRQEPRVFEPPDLLHEDYVTRTKQMGAAARHIYCMVQDDEPMLRHVLAWTNRNLPWAAQRLLGLTSDDLTQLMLDVRVALQREGRELVIFVEDFARTEGIQMELLEALMTRPDQGGQRLCTLRSVVAMTTGYYASLPDTVRTRVDAAVNLDTGFAGDRRDTLRSFVARYLNAVRLDREQLVEWHAEAVSAEGTSASPPSACADCAHQGKCHATFGATQDIGLYPFNTRALLRLYDIAPHQEELNPRAVVDHVLLKTLRLAPQIEAGDFPPSLLLPDGRGAMDAATQVELGQRVAETERDRCRVLLELWGDPKNLDSMRRALVEAFGLQSMGDGPTIDELDDLPVDGQTEEQTVEDEEDSAEVMIPPTVQARLDALDAWARGGEMVARTVNDLRSLLWRPTTERIDWDSEMLLRGEFRGDAKPFRRSSLNFEGQRPKPTGSFRLCLPLAGWTRERTAVALQGLVRYQHEGTWQFEGGRERYLDAAELLEQLSAHVVDRLRAEFGPDAAAEWDPVRSSTELLTIGALLMGRTVRVDSPPEDQLAALFGPTELSDASDIGERSVPWRHLRRAFSTHGGEARQVLLAFVGCTKGGSSSIQIVDAAAVLRHMRAYLRTGQIAPAAPAELPSMHQCVDRLWRAVDQHVGAAIDQETRKLHDWRDQVRRDLGEGAECVEAASALLGLVEVAEKAGVCRVGSEELRDLRALADRVGELDMASQLAAADTIGEADNAAQALSVLGAADLPTTTRESRAFIDAAKRFISETDRYVDSELRNYEVSGEETVSGADVNRLLDEVSGQLATLLGLEG